MHINRMPDTTNIKSVITDLKQGQQKVITFDYGNWLTVIDSINIYSWNVVSLIPREAIDFCALPWVRILISILLWVPQVETCCMTRVSYLHTRIYKRALHAASLSARCNLCMLPRCMPPKRSRRAQQKNELHCGFVSLESPCATAYLSII